MLRANTNAAAINCFDHWNQQGEFFLCRAPVHNGLTLKTAQDEHPMNLNFAFACMIVVSFAVALVHA